MMVASTGPFNFTTEHLGGLPVLNHFLKRVGLEGRLERYLPGDDPRFLVSPGSVVGVVAANIALRHRPLYALREWAATYSPELLGLSDASVLNDDRVGRALDRLFDADRASLLTETGRVSTRGNWSCHCLMDTND